MLRESIGLERLMDLFSNSEEQKSQTREYPLQSPASPPAVPTRTPELAWSKIKQILKRRLLSLRAVWFRSRVKPSAGAPDLNQCKRILVLRNDRLGDVVLTFPFVQSVKSVVPRAEVIYAVRDNAGHIYKVLSSSS